MANEFKIRKGLIVTGASGGTVVDVQGSQGQLFSVTDDLSGSIFAVSDISGVPIFNVNSSGLSTFYGNVNLPDNKKILLGTGSDLEIYHNGSDSYIKDAGTGDLRIVASATKIYDADMSHFQASFTDGGSVDLYYSGNKKFETTNTGAKVTGNGAYFSILDTSAAARNIDIGHWVSGQTNIESVGGTLSIGTQSNHNIVFETNASTKATILAGGNVGIGSTSPSSKLELGPNGSLGADITNKNVILNIDGGYGSTGTPSSGQYKVIGFTGTTRDVTDITGQTSGEVLKNFYLGMIGGDYFNVNRFSFWQGGDERLTIQGYGSAAGNVGIGDTSPVAKLDVAGDVQATSFYNLANPSPIMFPEGGTYNGNPSETGYIVIKLPDTGGSGQNNMMTCLVRIFDYANNESFDVRFNGYFYGSNYLWTRTAVWIDSSANVDRNFTVRFGKELGSSGSQDRAVVTIGEASGTWSYPKVAVIQYTPGHSEGAQPQIWNSGWDVSVVEDYWDGTDNTLDDTIINNQVNNWRRNGQDLYYGSGTGNVGIGTTDPGAKLELKKETTWGTLDNQAIYINNTGTGGDTSLLHDMGSITWRSSNVNTAAISGIRNTPGSGNNVDLRFTTATQSGGQQTSMTILSGGNVGIGTADPERILHLDADQGRAIIQLDKGGDKIVSIGTGSSATGADDTILQLINEGVEKVRIFTEGNSWLNGGKVGIGTTNPGAALEIANEDLNVDNTILNIGNAIVAPNTRDSWIKMFASQNTSDKTFAIGNAYGKFVVNYLGTRATNPLSAGSKIFTVDGPNGNVGIGTYTPNAKLDVQGTQGQLFSVTDDLSGDIFSVADISGVPIMNVNSDGTSYFDGDVGIGTDSPVQPLQVNGQVLFRTTTADGGKNRFQLIPGGSTDAANLYLYYGNIGDGTLSVRINAQGDSYFNGGNVGIGTTTPTNPLTIDFAPNGIGNITTSNNSTAWNTSSALFLKGASGSNGLGFGISATANDRKSWIQSGHPDPQYANYLGTLAINPLGGNVGIGTTTPSHKLEVGLTSSVALSSQPAIPLMVSNDGNGVDGRVFIQVKNDVVNTASAIGAGLQMTAAGVTSGTASYENSLIFLQSKQPGNQTIHSAPQNIKFHVDNDGTNAGAGANYNDLGDLAFELQTDGEAIFYYNVGVGNTGPSYKLDVSGTIRATGDVIAYSDERVKENIQTIDNSLEKVIKLRGVEFNKIGEDKKSIGVIAQEIEKILPEVVREDDKGMKSVAYGNITGILIEAIKELKAEIEELKKQIKDGNNL